MDETVDKKAKKARKPYVWTPQRKEAFERMRKKREELLTTKKTAKAQGKQNVEEEKRTLSDLLKNTAKIKQILALIDSKHQIEEKKPEFIPAIKAKKSIPKPVPPPVQQQEEESDAYSEEEEDYEVPQPTIPTPIRFKIPEVDTSKQPKQTFRYNTQVSKSNLPKPPTEIRKPEVDVPEKRKPTFQYL
jgi:hypothetical protein